MFKEIYEKEIRPYLTEGALWINVTKYKIKNYIFTLNNPLMRFVRENAGEHYYHTLGDVGSKIDRMNHLIMKAYTNERDKPYIFTIKEKAEIIKLTREIEGKREYMMDKAPKLMRPILNIKLASYRKLADKLEREI